MHKIIFLCHGNICRSPAAEWAMKFLLVKYGLEDRFEVISRATSTEEIGNDIYPPMKRALYNREIPFYQHSAKQITKEDYEWADYIFYMDEYNQRNLNRLINDYKHIAFPISKYTASFDIIDDPWYSGQFDEVLDQIYKCCEDIIRNIK